MAPKIVRSVSQSVALVLLSSSIVSAQGPGLVDAVRQGDVRRARILVQKGADVAAVEPDGTTALHWAAHRGDATLVDLLLAAGANPVAANRYQVTPLSLAAENGNAAVIERLLKAGANANASLPGGETALMTAARTGRAEAVKVLLAHGADVNARETFRGQTALMWAAAQGHAAAIKALIEAGADVRARSHGPAVRAPRTEELDRTYAARDIRRKDRDYRRKDRIDALTPLLFAVQLGRIDAARALLDGGADVTESLEDGTSPLMLALANKHWELASLLLDRGSNPNETTKGWTPLHQVARSRTLNTGEFPQANETGRMSSVDLARKLLTLGAKVDATMVPASMNDGYSGGFDRRGATPLLLASHGADHEMMRLLIEHGADPQRRSRLNSSILMLAAGVEIGQLGATGGTNEDALIAVRYAIDVGLDVNATNDLSQTALHGAAGERGSNELVELLVAHGARLDAKDSSGCTPIRLAQGDRHACGLSARSPRPATFALLHRIMTERGVPIEIRRDEELYGFEFGTPAKSDDRVAPR
jgi:uncharacterized protein